MVIPAACIARQSSQVTKSNAPRKPVYGCGKGTNALPVGFQPQANVLSSNEERGRSAPLDQDGQRVGHAVLDAIVERHAEIPAADAAWVLQGFNRVVHRDEIAVALHVSQVRVKAAALVVHDEMIEGKEHPVAIDRQFDQRRVDRRQRFPSEVSPARQPTDQVRKRCRARGPAGHARARKFLVDADHGCAVGVGTEPIAHRRPRARTESCAQRRVATHARQRRANRASVARLDQ
jgi:hypothetical protein